MDALKVLWCADPEFGSGFEAVREALEGTGIDIQRCPMSRVPEFLPSAHVAVPAMTKFDRAMLERAGTNLRAVIQFGVGVEGVDFACASERGIAVANIPSDAVPLNPNAASCAEMAVYLILHALQRSVKDGLLGVPGGDTLLGKTALIVGFGNIGKELAVRLKPFGVRLLSVRRSPWGSQGSELERRAEAVLDAKGEWGQLHAFAGEADIVFPTVAQNAETTGFVSADFLSACKDGVMIVNVSRGGVLDYEAVRAGLEVGKIGAMGLDVQWSEPFDPTDPLAQRDDVILTPHVGGVTSLSYAGMARFLADQCIRLKAENKPPITSINCSQDWEFHT